MAKENVTKYTENDEWARLEGGIVTVGITDFAQKELGDLVYVDYNEHDTYPGTKFEKDDEIVILESAKTTASVYAPVSGEVVEINESLKSDPDKINESPFESGWLVKLDMKDETELEYLMEESEYEELKKEEA